MELEKGSNDDDVQLWSQLMNDVFKTIYLHLHDDEKTRQLLLGMIIALKSVNLARTNYEMLIPRDLGRIEQSLPEGVPQTVF